jgi:hypothetical protein
MLVSLPRIGQDGNGVVNFGEFASWAGPRLGLELGLASQTFRDFPVFSGIFYSFTKGITKRRDLKTQKEGQLFFCYVIF